MSFITTEKLLVAKKMLCSYKINALNLSLACVTVVCLVEPFVKNIRRFVKRVGNDMEPTKSVPDKIEVLVSSVNRGLILLLTNRCAAFLFQFNKIFRAGFSKPFFCL